ncbi:MAG: hypothetical protein AB7J34_16810 [Limisphaerales bacterium]
MLQPNPGPERGPPDHPHPRNGKPPLPGGDALRDSPNSAPLPRVTVPLGRTVITANAAAVLAESDVLRALFRHSTGDWGNLCPEDRAPNDGALIEGTRLLSSYRSQTGIVFWIITEADRSLTTVLLPEDY